MENTQPVRTATDRAAINALLSARILAGVRDGMPIDAAYDHALGQGAFTAMAGELYDALRARVSTAEAERVANELCGPPVDSHVSRAYACSKETLR